MALTAASGGCTPEAVTPGETLVVVDTDLPVPDVVEAVRLDVYGEDGTWLSSRDVDVAEPGQWPLSFGVAAPEGRAARVLVRVRAYPKGRLRDYTGAGRATTAPFHDEPLPANLDELCAKLPDLNLGGTVALRLGETPITAPLDDGGCANDAGPVSTRSGAAAARVRIDTAGAYRFEVVGEVPVGFYYTLFLRKDCADAGSEVSCARGRRDATTNPVSELEVTLDPGIYTLLATDITPDQASQLVVRATAVGAPAPDGGAAADAGDPKASVPPIASPAWPRLVSDGRDNTPPKEPREEVSTEAFALLDVASKAVRTARVVLGGDCVGKAARVPALSERRLDVAGVLACEAGRMVAPHLLVTAAGAPAKAPSTLLGAYAKAQACAPTADGRVCIPGGMTVFGSDLFTGIGDTSTTPERIVRFPTFYIDKDEFTVAEFRAARAAGYTLPAGPYVVATQGPLDPRALDRKLLCTYSTNKLNREDMPLNCVTWPVARDLCRQRGGELPTEAAWEYVARKAGKPRATLYPWGNEEPTCDRAIYDRVLQGPQTGICAPTPDLEGPQPRSVVSGDVTPLGVRNLAGSLDEWTLDAFAPYTQSCWLGAPVDAPRCELAGAPFRTFRGASYASVGSVLASPLRDRLPVMDPGASIGFRCVYPSP
jgi:formylglycine-generating enzyme required for sulfatase activity